MQWPLRHTLHSHMRAARMRSDEVFALLNGRALYERPIAERHRLIFYLGHVEAFEWNLICSREFGMKSQNPEFDSLFAFGIDPTNGNLPGDKPGDWPRESEVLQYNQTVRRAIDQCLERGVEESPDDLLFWVAIEHRLMHAETLSYLVHGLPFSLKRVPAGSMVLETNSDSPAAKMAAVPEGFATLGLERKQNAFGWDNEFDAHCIHVPEFEIGVHKVTNAEYLEFVRAGGYSERSFWSDSSWQWITSSGIRHSKFWVPHNGDWRIRTMFADIPFQTSWPVYVSHSEAAAYCRWKGCVLPTEAQYHRAAFGAPDGTERDYPWGNAPPQSNFGNFDYERWDPVAVDAHPAGASAFGISGLAGNGWEWTSTLFAPFEGFEPFPFYPGYSADFFDGGHYVMKGGSPRTAALLLRRSFRNWFQPRYPHIYASFRCVQCN
jgi:iron(II)-dependent oxidoreductase